ncbi:MAG: hypothetical protein H8D47_03505, partial [Planctomycetes bacterium]|nr:hypothetical protein [Planctomycetota bacterium]
GARIGIAGQSLGIAEATYRIARDYAASRKQFGTAIENFPAVKDMLIEMKIATEAGRSLLYETSRAVDMLIGYEKIEELNPPQDKQELKAIKNQSRKYKRLAAMLTPMSKYYCSEMSNTISYDAIQVLGGSGYMRDYACERHARDARITTIYEGTSQLQVVAAVRGVCSGTAEKYLTELADKKYNSELKDCLEKLTEGTDALKKSIVFVKKNGNDYMDLYGRALVDIAIDLILGYLFCEQASSDFDMQIPISAANGKADENTISMKQRKAMIAKRFISKNSPKIMALSELVCSGDKSSFTDYSSLVNPLVTE